MTQGSMPDPGPRGLRTALRSIALLAVVLTLGSLVTSTYGAQWQVATAQGPTAPGQQPPPAEHHEEGGASYTAEFSAESPLYAAVRWLTFMGLLGVIGAVAFRLVVLWLLCRKRDPVGRAIVRPAAVRAARFGLGAVAVLAIALVLRLYAQSYALHGGGQPLDSQLVGTLLSRTTWGWGWLLQAAGTLVALAGFLMAEKDGRLGWALASLGAISLAFTPGLSGHAVATADLASLAVLADALHVLGAGGWLGSLLLVVIVGIPVALRRRHGDRGQAVAELISAFSPTALFFTGTVVATGVFAAWLQLGTVSALWESAYGRTLLLKLALVSVVFGTGAYNWLRVKPILGSEVAAGRLRRSAALELAVGVAVLAVTAVLVATATPTSMEIAPTDTPIEPAVSSLGE